MQNQKNILLRQSNFGYMNSLIKKNELDQQMKDSYQRNHGNSKDRQQLIGGNVQKVDNHDEISNILAKFKRFIEFHAIDAFQIWEGNSVMSYLMFINTIQKKIGYRFNSTQINGLRMMAQQGNLNVNSFKEYKIWNNTLTDSNSTYLNKIHLKATHRSKIIQNDQRSRMSHEKSQKSTENKLFLNSIIKENKKEKKKGDFEKSKFFKSWVGEAADENKIGKIECLSKNLQMNQLQKKWQLVVMAGEMNKWIQSSSTSKDGQERTLIKFKIVNKQSEFEIVKIDQKGSFEIIPQVVFYKKYNAMKKKQAKHKQLLINQLVPQIFTQAASQVKGRVIGISKQIKRQKQLNETLLHIMRIKNVLQHQYKVLSQCAINT